MAEKASSCAQIQGTNDSSIASKLSSARKGYFKDDFLQYFVDKHQNRSPLINRGYYIRFKAIEAVFNVWFDALENLKSEESQVISLGAGFDSSYFRLKSQGKLPRNCKYVEVDFPEVLLKKWAYISSTPKLLDLVEAVNLCQINDPNKLLFCATNYFLIGADLNDIGKFENLCIEAGINFSVPTLFLSECAITYMHVNSSQSLIIWAREKWLNSSFVLYEQVYPDDGFGLVMKKHFYTLGSPLKSIDTYPDLLSQKNRFLKMGWKSCDAKLMTEFFASLPAEEVFRIKNLELFDEYEPWHQKCSHYMLVCASQGVIPLSQLFCELIPENDNELNYASTLALNRITACSDLHRFGHQICFINSDNLIISGGFGKLNNKHQKLKGIFHYNLETMSSSKIVIEDHENKLGQRMFHTMLRLQHNILIIGGRSAPTKPYSDTLLLHLSEFFASHEGKSEHNMVINDCCEAKIENLKCSCIKIPEIGDVPSPRWRHTASVVEINGAEKVFLFGGCTATKNVNNDCYLLDTSTWCWSKVPFQKDTPSERHSHSSVTLEKKVFVSGGLSHDERPMRSIHSFNVETLSWLKLKVCGLFPRYSHTSHIWRNYLFLIGGVNTLRACNPCLAMIDLATLNATEYSMPGQDPSFPILLNDHASVIYEDKIVIFGGGGNCFSFGTHFNVQLLEIELKLIT